MTMRALLSVAVFGAFAVPAFSHDYWLAPETFFPKSKQLINVRLFVGDHFKPQIERPFQKKITTRFELISHGKTTDLTAHAKNGKKPVVQLRIAAPGTHCFVMERDFTNITLTAEKFNGYLKHEGLTNILKLREKAGEKKKEGREKYSRYLKCMIRVGDKRDATWKKVMKQRLEILPLSDPTVLKKGDSLKVRILFEGKPLGRAAFFSLSKINGKVREQPLRTDNSGFGAVRILGAGPHLVRLVHMRRCKSDPKIDWESYWGALSFGVR